MSNYHGLTEEITADNCIGSSCTRLELNSISRVQSSNTLAYIYNHCLHGEEKSFLTLWKRKTTININKFGILQRQLKESNLHVERPDDCLNADGGNYNGDPLYVNAGRILPWFDRKLRNIGKVEWSIEQHFATTEIVRIYLQNLRNELCFLWKGKCGQTYSWLLMKKISSNVINIQVIVRFPLLLWECHNISPHYLYTTE